MKTSFYHAVGAALILACAAAGAWAGDPQTPPPQAQAPAVQSAKDEIRSFRTQSKAERDAFRSRQQDERKAFNESLKGKSREEQKSLRAQFQAKQKSERAAFHKSEHEKRQAYREAHPSEGGQHRRKNGPAPKSN